jgi:UDP-N-acetyl-D-galactosamine dehydrogenase
MMLKKDIAVKNANVLVLGITFKENCPDIRNSRAIDVVRELQDYQMNVDVFDPWASAEEVKHEYNLDLISKIDKSNIKYNAVLAVVAHNEFKEMDIKPYLKENALIYDVKAIYPKEDSDLRL